MDSQIMKLTVENHLNQEEIVSVEESSIQSLLLGSFGLWSCSTFEPSVFKQMFHNAFSWQFGDYSRFINNYICKW
jgi:hypothetical protein